MRNKIIAGLIIFIALGIVILFYINVVMDQGLNFRAYPRSLLDTIRSTLQSKKVTQNNHGEYTNIIFLHHSVGGNLIKQGNVREILSQSGYQFWDHNYNYIGLRGPDGIYVGYSYMVPGDNTDPDGLARIFGQKSYPWPLNTFSALLQHEVIAFKSCFPASNIIDNEQLDQHKARYLEIRDVMDQYPEKVFTIVTSPPLNPAHTTLEAAANARAFSNWLQSEEYLAGHPNIFVFDLLDLLAEDDPQASDFNMLRLDYRNGDDSHPNKVANEEIGPIFVDFVLSSIEEYSEIK